MCRGSSIGERNKEGALGEGTSIYKSVICVYLCHWWLSNCRVHTLNWYYCTVSLECYMALPFLNSISYWVSKYLILKLTAKIAYFGCFCSWFKYWLPHILESHSISPPFTYSVWFLFLAGILRAIILELTNNDQFCLI